MNDYVAGSLGGAAGVIAGHPFDTVKVQFQTQEFVGKYSNLLHVYKTVGKQSLSKGFFRGLSWPLFSYSGTNAIFFGVYGFTLKKITGSESTEINPPNYTAIGIASGTATLPTMLVFCPVEVIKTTLQSQIPHSATASFTKKPFYHGPTQAFKTIFKSLGVRGLYRGMLTHTIRDVPANTLYMVSYTFMQTESKRWIPSVPSQLVNFVGGGIAGVLSWTIIMPFDVVKSKLQVDVSKKVYQGFFDCARVVYANGGFKAFFTGYLTVALRAFPVNAITLMVYSESLLYLNKFHP